LSHPETRVDDIVDREAPDAAASKKNAEPLERNSNNSWRIYLPLGGVRLLDVGPIGRL